MRIVEQQAVLDRIEEASSSPLGLVLPDTTTYEEWANLGPALGLMERASRWWIGDWVNFGERHWGEKYSQAIEDTGLTYGSLANAAWVAKHYEISRRREKLGWSHHSEVASLPSAEADVWLDVAEEFGYSRNRLREEIQQARQAIAEPAPALALSPVGGQQWTRSAFLAASTGPARGWGTVAW